MPDNITLISARQTNIIIHQEGLLLSVEVDGKQQIHVFMNSLDTRITVKDNRPNAIQRLSPGKRMGIALWSKVRSLRASR